MKNMPISDVPKYDSIETRLSVARNTATPPEILAELAKDSNVVVRCLVALNPITTAETLKKLSNDFDGLVAKYAKHRLAAKTLET